MNGPTPQGIRLRVHMTLLLVAGFLASGWCYLVYLTRVHLPETLLDRQPELFVLITLGATGVGLVLGLGGGSKALDKQRSISGWLWAAWAPLYLAVLVTHLIILL